MEKGRCADAEPAVEEKRLQVFPLCGVVLRNRSKHSVQEHLGLNSRILRSNSAARSDVPAG